ncbi:MAG: cupin domain-containing protein [Myxococcota bacterium]|jgi:quercetin dioxygenase-like cupin family protein|nr:cupin domain-containing protein [Myxococcota bacterium]
MGRKGFAMHQPSFRSASLLAAALTVTLAAGFASADPPSTAPHRVSAGATPTHALQDGKLRVQVLLDRDSVGATDAALSLLTAHAGAAAPDHTHEGAELIYVLEGRASMTIGEQLLELAPGDAVHIPAGAHHTFTVPDGAPPLKVLQVYVPGGPEQRFKGGELIEVEPAE